MLPVAARADASSMEPAAVQTAELPADAGRLVERHRVLRDGDLVAVLSALDHGSTFAVVAEFVADAGEAMRVRPYTFARVDEATAFLTDAVDSLAFLGCEIQRI